MKTLDNSAESQRVKSSIQLKRRILSASSGLVILEFVLWICTFIIPLDAFAIGGLTYVSHENGKGEFALSVLGKSVPLCISSKDYPGVIRALRDLQSDIGKVTGAKSDVVFDSLQGMDELVLVGTIGQSPLIDKLVQDKKFNLSDIEGKWESYIIQVVDKPLPGVERALVIAGSDKRGTIYGIYDLSEKIGVSPWYWWGDVPIRHENALYVKPIRYVQGPPSVKYRGIFLNDEAPDLSNWVYSKFGTVPVSQNPPIPSGVANYNHLFYEKVFELILRLKGNYLWPAMWNNAFNEDDSLNPKLADEYGIVMGTSHQEPMLRAQKEWDRRYSMTIGPWNFAKYPDTVTNFWREGIRRNRNYESIVTIGLRGPNDTPMAPGGPEANMALLGKIVDVQRNILKEEMNPDVTKVPQLWCPYKEVLDFYNAGFRVPEDVTILWTDDNWGNIRRLPTSEERKRNGGAGVYYHFDYHGGPRNYEWINTNPISKIWDQMSLAKDYGADRIWIVNVGHLKGYELPMQYFLDLAWDTPKWTNSNIDEYTRLWAEQQFGPTYAKEIADIISKYTQYNGRRKPELLTPTTYSLTNYHEAENVIADFKSITEKAEEIYNKLPADERDAFYELVLFPTKASEIVNELYVAAGKNALYAKQGRASTDEMADQVRSLFQSDTSLMGYFNRTFANGKWDHFMDQPVLGYTGWNQPNSNNLNAIHLNETSNPDAASMGVALEGSEESWPGAQDDAVLPPYDEYNRQSYSIDIFNRGKSPFQYSVDADVPWIKISSTEGEVEKQTTLQVSVDWTKAPGGTDSGIVKITGAGQSVPVKVKANNTAKLSREGLRGFVEGEGFVSIEAEHYTGKTEAGADRWINVEDYGNTLSGMRATSPFDAPAATPGKASPCLEYKMFLFDTGKVDVEGIFGSSLNFMPDLGLRYAVSFDDASPEIVTLVPAKYVAGYGRDWEESVADNVRHSHTSLTVDKPGYHTLKIWMVDPGVVLEKIVVNCGGVKPSYLGPPESFHREVASNK